MDPLVAFRLFTLAILAGACGGSRGMSPEAISAEPPKLQVISRTIPPASPPYQLLNRRRHSMVGSPSARSPRIWFGQGPSSPRPWDRHIIARGQIYGAPALPPSELQARTLPSHHSHIRGHVPFSSSKSPSATAPTDVASPPLIPNLKPGKRKKAQPPLVAPMGSLQHSSGIGAPSPHPPPKSNLPSRHQGPSISRLPSIRKHSSAAPPIQNHSSAAPPKEQRRHTSYPVPGIHASAPSPSASFPVESGVPPHSGVFPFAPAPISESSKIPSPAHAPISESSGIPSPSPALAPTSEFSGIPSPAPAPKQRHARALPPLPSNPDCSSLSCTESLTYSPPVSPCACVQPMKVSLRLGVELYTFFPLVSELAEEIASGTFLNQSQVRIMGANAGSEQPEKTIVLVDLVPFGERFNNSTAFLLYERFWQKQVKIRTTHFGDYDILNITYPGLPPPPPMSASNSVGNGRFGRKNNSRTEHPLGVDVGGRKEKLSDSMIAIIVVSSVIALILCAGVAWLFILKHNNQSFLPSRSQNIAAPFVKVTGNSPM